MRFIETLKRLFVACLLVALAACSSAPKQAQEAADGEENAAEQPVATDKEAPAGLDLSAPDQNPYKTQQVEVPDGARSLFKDATAAMAEEDWRKAEVLLQQLTTEYPELSGPYVNLGIVYRELDNYSDAETAFKRAIEANKLNLNAYNQLGLILRQQGRFADAEAAYQGALEAWPKHARSHKNLGILYDLYMGKWEQALQHFEIYQYLQDEPDRSVAGWIIDLKRRIKQQG